MRRFSAAFSGHINADLQHRRILIERIPNNPAASLGTCGHSVRVVDVLTIETNQTNNILKTRLCKNELFCPSSSFLFLYLLC